MTAREALHAKPRATDQAVPLDGLLGVAGATRLEPARGRQPREGHAVSPDHQDPQPFQACVLPSPAPIGPIVRSSASASCRYVASALPGLATTRMSQPPDGRSIERSKRLANPAPDPIADDRAADSLAGRDPEAVPAEPVAAIANHEQGVCPAAALFLECGKVSLRTQHLERPAHGGVRPDVRR